MSYFLLLLIFGVVPLALLWLYAPRFIWRYRGTLVVIALLIILVSVPWETMAIDRVWYYSPRIVWSPHLPSARDTVVQHGLYAYTRHPIYAGGAIVMPGLVLIRPRLTVLVASSLAFVWFFLWARLEEIDLVQRIPEYREYLCEVPRFIPSWRR